MPDQTSPPPLARTVALRTALTVAVLGGIWVLISIVLFRQLPGESYELVHEWAEIVFIVILSLGVFGLIYRSYRHAERAADERRQSETRYRAIADTIMDFAYATKINADGTLVMDWANDSLSKITGYDRTDLIGRGTLRDLIHPDDVALFDARTAQLRRGEAYSGDFRIRTKTGDTRWIHDQARLVWNADHTRPEYIYGASQDITERKAAEAALRASEERLRHVTDNMLDMVSQTDLTGQFLYVSPSHQPVLGYTPDQLVGHSMFEFVHPDDLSRAVTTYHTSLATRISGGFELRYRHADGHYLWLEIIGQLLLDNTGQPYGATFGSRDITARRQRDEARARYTRNLKDLYEAALAINSQPDLPSLFAVLIERALALSGATMGGVYLMQPDRQSLELMANVPPEYQHTIVKLGEGLAGRVAQSEAPLVVSDYSTWDGRLAAFEHADWGRVLAVPLKLGGRILGVLDVEDSTPGAFDADDVRVISLLADQAALAIDNRRLYEQARQDLIARQHIEEQLRESETRYREVVENVGEGINVADEHELVIFANPAMHDILGVEAGQLPGRNWREFTDAAAFEQIQQQTALRRTGQVSTYELPIIRADGQRRTLLVTARPRFDQTGRYVGAFSVLRDITARAQAEAALTRTRNDLARRNEQLTQILESSNTIRSQLDLTQVLDEIATAAYRSLGFRIIAVNLIDAAANRVRIAAIVGDDDHGRELLDGAEYEWSEVRQLLEARFRRGRCYFIPQGEFDWEHDFSGLYHDALQTPIIPSPNREAWQPADALIIPIELRDGEIAGLLWPDGPVDGLRPNADTLRLLEIFAAQAAIAIETARLFEAERLQRTAFEALYHASRQMTRSLDLSTVLDMILREVIKLVPAANAHIFLYDGDQLHFGAARVPSGPLGAPFSEPRPAGLTYTTARSGDTLFIEDSASHPLYAHTTDAWRPFAIASLPLKNRGTVVGVMNVGFGAPRRFPEAEQALLTLFAAQGAIAIQNARLHQQVQEHAHQLEQRVADRTAELDRQRQRLQTVLDAAGEGIQILDAAGRTEYFNPATERLTGYRIEEAVGQVARFLVEDDSASSPAVRDLQRAYQSGRAWQGELVSRRRDGTAFNVAITLTPLIDKAGAPTGYVAIHRDVTRFHELDRLKDQFVSRIGHELRTPVANIKLYLELLERSQPDRHAQYVQTLKRETDRLRRLIDGFLEMAQLDAGAVIIRPTAVDLNQVLGDVIEDRQPIAEARHLTLTARLRAELPRVQTDHTLVAQALANLMDNALSYTPADGCITLATDLRFDDRGQWVTLSISDTGPGIAPDELPRLSERFYRGAAARDFRVPGAGLGLSIVQASLAQIDGRLTIDSTVGHGATFTLWLPVV